MLQFTFTYWAVCVGCTLCSNITPSLVPTDDDYRGAFDGLINGSFVLFSTTESSNKLSLYGDNYIKILGSFDFDVT